MIELKYSLVIEATEDPTFFGFYSPDLEGFTGIGHSVEDCLYQAKWGMEEHVGLLREQSLPIPNENPDPKIIIQNQEPLASLHFRVKELPNTSRNFGVIQVSGIAEPDGNHSTTEQTWFYRYSRRQSTAGYGLASGV